MCIRDRSFIVCTAPLLTTILSLWIYKKEKATRGLIGIMKLMQERMQQIIPKAAGKEEPAPLALGEYKEVDSYDATPVSYTHLYQR